MYLSPFYLLIKTVCDITYEVKSHKLVITIGLSKIFIRYLFFGAQRGMYWFYIDVLDFEKSKRFFFCFDFTMLFFFLLNSERSKECIISSATQQNFVSHFFQIVQEKQQTVRSINIYRFWFFFYYVLYMIIYFFFLKRKTKISNYLQLIHLKKIFILLKLRKIEPAVIPFLFMIC